MRLVVSFVFCWSILIASISEALVQHPSKPLYYRKVYHNVKLNENLYLLARRYNKSLKQLRYWNNLKDLNQIKAGTILIVGYLKPKPGKQNQTLIFIKNNRVDSATSNFDSSKVSPPTATKLIGLPKTAKATLPVNFHEISSIQKKSKHFSVLSLNERMLVGTVLLFLTTAAGVFVTVFASRLYKIKQSIQTKQLHKKYEALLMEVLFSEEEIIATNTAIVTNPVLTKSLHNSFNRQVLVKEIIRLHKNFSGDFAKNLEDFFIQLGLEQESYRKLKSRHWYLKAQGISELAEMNVKTSSSAIEHYIEHPNEILRMVAQLAILKLSDEGILGFLNRIKTALTDWHQLNLQQVLAQKDRDQVPEFSQWLLSPNFSVVEFSVKMIGIYNQVSAIPVLINLLEHQNIKVKLASVQALQKLDASEALAALENTFYAESNKELKLAIIRCLESIGHQNIGFFKNELCSSDFDISLAAAKAIINLTETGVDYINALRKDANKQLHAIIDHVLDTRI